MVSRPRVLIVEDHNLLAELYSKVLEAECDVVGIVGDGNSMVQSALRLKPDLVVTDIAMPGLNGLEAAEEVRARLPSIKLIFVTMTSDETIAAEAFRRGASAYLLKTCAASELLAAVRKVLLGLSYLSPSLRQEQVNYMRTRKPVDIDQRLSDRQLEVVRLIAEGKNMHEIAAALNLSHRTVAFHKYRIMEKLGVTRGADLVRYAVKNGLVSE